MNSNFDKARTVGRWCIGERRWDVDRIGYFYALEIGLRKRPPLLRRWLVSALFGILWRDGDHV